MQRNGMSILKIFVSSVQKELENERIAVTELVSSDPFLNRNITPILFEQLPASAKSAEVTYLEALRSCNMYIGIIGFQYGRKGPDGLSATHREYLEAKRLGLPTYFFIKGDNSQDTRRDADLSALFRTIQDEQHGHVYKRFTHYQSLKEGVRSVLLQELQARGVSPSSEERQIAEQTIAQTSDFDSGIVERVDETHLDNALCREYVSAITVIPEKDLDREHVHKTLVNRGMLWKNGEAGSLHPTAAGLLLLGTHPDEVFPQARIAANAYGGRERGDPIDRDDIREPLPRAIERTFQFLKRNMRHTTRIEGFSKVEINEYPYAALREAVVNAVAHRDYYLSGTAIRVEKYADRIEVISPGLPPEPITLEKIERLDYIACSRNPNIARGLSYFERIEEQGDGLRRIVKESISLGLPRPQFQFRDGHFKIIFLGPGDDMLKLKIQSSRAVFKIDDDQLAELSETQKSIIQVLLLEKEVRVPMLSERLKISEQAVRKALKPLKEKGLIRQGGKARETFYELNERRES